MTDNVESVTAVSGTVKVGYSKDSFRVILEIDGMAHSLNSHEAQATAEMLMEKAGEAQRAERGESG